MLTYEQLLDLASYWKREAHVLFEKEIEKDKELTLVKEQNAALAKENKFLKKENEMLKLSQLLGGR